MSWKSRLVDVIVRVYPTRRIQMQGSPDWIDSERFDIVAKVDEADGEVKQDQWSAMVKLLLEDRFKLAFHPEARDMPVLALVGKPPAGLSRNRRKANPLPSLVNAASSRSNIGRSRVWSTLPRISCTRPSLTATGINGFYDFSARSGAICQPG